MDSVVHLPSKCLGAVVPGSHIGLAAATTQRGTCTQDSAVSLLFQARARRFHAVQVQWHRLDRWDRAVRLSGRALAPRARHGHRIRPLAARWTG